jgi:hypothetical protein
MHGVKAEQFHPFQTWSQLRSNRHLHNHRSFPRGKKAHGATNEPKICRKIESKIKFCCGRSVLGFQTFCSRVLMKSSEQSRSMRLPITCQVKAMNVQQGLVFATEQTSRTPWLNVFIPLLLLLLILLLLRLLRLLRLLLLLVNASAFDRGKSIRAS